MTPVAATNLGSPQFYAQDHGALPFFVCPAQQLRRCGKAIVAAGYMTVLFIAYTYVVYELLSGDQFHHEALFRKRSAVRNSRSSFAGNGRSCRIGFSRFSKLGTMQVSCRGCLAEL